MSNKPEKKHKDKTDKEKIREITRIYEQIKREEQEKERSRVEKAEKPKKERKKTDSVKPRKESRKPVPPVTSEPHPPVVVPEKRPLNSYQKFVQKMSKKEEFRNMKASERISLIANLWRKKKEKEEEDSYKNLSKDSFMGKFKKSSEESR